MTETQKIKMLNNEICQIAVNQDELHRRLCAKLLADAFDIPSDIIIHQVENKRKKFLSNCDDTKPILCPFCGGIAEVHSCLELDNKDLVVHYSGKCGVHCTECHAATTLCESESDAIKAWNRRV